MIAPEQVLITGAAGAIGGALARAMRAAWPATRLALLDRPDHDASGARPERADAIRHDPTRGEAAIAHSTAARVNGPTRGEAATEHGTATRNEPTRDEGAMARSAATGNARAHPRAHASAEAEGRTRPTNAVIEQLAAELGNAVAVMADLRDVDALPAAIEPLGTIDGLVNCAGIMIVQQLQTWSWETARDLMAVDLIAPLRLQDLVVRGMIERRRGVIVNVASMAGKVALKGCAYYGASKAGIAMASEIARAELAPHGIRVVTVYPGPVRSALEQAARDGYGGGGLFGRFAPTGEPAELARRIMDAIERDEPRVIYPRLYGVGWSATNLSRWIALSYGPPPVA